MLFVTGVKPSKEINGLTWSFAIVRKNETKSKIGYLKNTRPM